MRKKLNRKDFNSIEEWLAASRGMTLEEFRLYMDEVTKNSIENFRAYQEEKIQKRPNSSTIEHIKELQNILVQTCIDYIIKHNISDIEEVIFSADSLQSSADFGEWTPATDSSITFFGLREGEGESKLSERYEINSYC